MGEIYGQCGYGSQLFSALPLALSKCAHGRAEEVCDPAISSLSPCKMRLNGSLCNEFYGPDDTPWDRGSGTVLLYWFTLQRGYKAINLTHTFWMHPTLKTLTTMVTANKGRMCPLLVGGETFMRLSIVAPSCVAGGPCKMYAYISFCFVLNNNRP